jgi:hypothetical protein
MPYTPENNPVKIDAELEEKIRTAPSAEHIAQYLRDAYVAQNLAQADEFNPTHFTPTKIAENPQAQRFAKRVDGQIFEGNSEPEVDRAIADYMRSKMAQPETRTEVARDDKGRFTAEQGPENVVAKVDLELRFKRGEISTAEYLEQSGAMAEYLEKQGVPLEALKTVVEEKQTQRYEQSWQSATEEFLNSPEGRTWPGGQQNLKRAGELIQQMGATDAEDKVAALVAAYRHMKENDMLAVNPDLVAKQREQEALKKISEASSPDEIRQFAVEYRGGNSSIWGR